MKRALTALATISIILAPAALAESKTFSASSFDQVEVNGVMDVVYKSGNDTKVVVETPSGDFSDAVIENDGDTLIITRKSVQKKSSFFSWGNSIDVSKDGETVKVNGKRVPRYTVYVTGPDLDGVKVSQSSTFNSQTINSSDFSIGVSSSAKAKVAGSAGTARISASSSGDVDASKLEAKTLTISASSSGDADGLVTGTGETDVQASSSGDVTVRSNGASSFKAQASSGGSVELSGSCSSIEASASSGAEIDADELRCSSAVARASSGGDVDLYSTGLAKGSASSGGDIRFKGNPSDQQSSESSGGSVRFTS